MGESLQKAFTGVIALSLAVIAIQLIPFNRFYKAKNLCAEGNSIDFDLKGKNLEIDNRKANNRLRTKNFEKLLSHSGIKRGSFNFVKYCASFE